MSVPDENAVRKLDAEPPLLKITSRMKVFLFPTELMVLVNFPSVPLNKPEPSIIYEPSDDIIVIGNVNMRWTYEKFSCATPNIELPSLTKLKMSTAFAPVERVGSVPPGNL